MANWLDKYEQGGLVLKKKTKDNYGKRENPNDVKASVGPDFVGLGYNTKGRDYSPAWGGQFAMGGALPGAVGFTYARVAGSAPANGKYTKKTKASAQDGKKVAKKELTEEQYYNPPTPINKSGNTAMDMVSSNPWLMKVPILGNYIKDEAYRNAAMSEGFSTFAPVDTKQAEELMGKGYNAVGKYTGGGDEKYDLLKQYIYGDQNLQSSPYSPKDDYLKFLPSYSLKDKAGIKPQAYWKELILNNKYMDYSKDLENVVKTHKPKFYSQESDDMSALSRMYNTPPDLGHYKAGIGYDEDVNLPYVSVSDAWDFYPKDYQKMWSQSERDRSGDAYQQSYLMHKAGKPFKIYDRVYVDPKTKEPISDKEIIPKKLEKKFTPKGLSERVTQELHKGIDKSYNPYMQNGGEMAFYQNGLDWKPKTISKNGSVIKDDRGQWAHPGEITEIGSNNITMQGVDYPVIGVSDTGDTQMMQPNQDYKFDGDKVTEYPMMQEGGWLSKYDNISATSPLKKQAEEFLAKRNNPSNRPSISQYTPKPGEQAKFDKQKLERIAEDNAPLNRMAASKGAANMQDAALFALDVMLVAEGVGAIKSALKSKAKNVIASKVTRGPINYWEEPGFAKRNPNFNPEAYANSPIGNASASRDIPEGMTPYIKVDDVTPNVKPSWKSQELPGLHISATMEGGPISKIIEPKTGLINVDQALTIIGKESGGASKVDMIKQALGKDIPKKMDYNDFRKTVQDQLIPLEREVVNTFRSAYNIDKLGYTKASTDGRDIILNRINNTRAEILKFETKGTPEGWEDYFKRMKENLETDLKEYSNLPLENQTIRLSNRSKFGKGADTHGNPEETLGHIHFLRDAESPDVLTMTQLQSDAFQSTNRTMPKSLEEANAKLNKLKDDVNYTYKTFGNSPADLQTFKDVINKAKESLSLEEASVKNFSQKSLLDKNHQERYLQELVDYAGKRGDINKIRVPTSETAAKVQGYRETSLTGDNAPGFGKLQEEISIAVRQGDQQKVNDLMKVHDEMLKTPYKTYSSDQKTILKKYSEQPKVIKKVFGVEPKTVKDSKGNSWYEFDIPAKFKGGKGEIKAFEDGGWLNKYK